MSGYGASARIVGATPHLARPDGVRVGPGHWIALESAAAAAVVDGPVTHECRIVDDARCGAVAVRWAAARERWSQLTFFLFDSNSWR